MFLILLLTLHTDAVIPSIAKKKQQENITSLLPYAKVYANNKDKNTLNTGGSQLNFPPLIIFNENILPKNKNKIKLIVYSTTKLSLKHSEKGGLKITNISKETSTLKYNTLHATQYNNYILSYKFTTAYFPKYLNLNFTNKSGETELFLPLIKYNSKLNNFVQVAYSRDTIIVSTPANYKVLWITNGYNNFYAQYTEPNTQGNIWIYTYKISDSPIIPSIGYIYHNNSFSIIKLDQKQIAQQVLTDNLYKKFTKTSSAEPPDSTTKDSKTGNNTAIPPTLSYKIIKNYLVIKIQKRDTTDNKVTNTLANDLLLLQTQNDTILNNVYYTITPDYVYYYLDLRPFKQKTLALKATLNNASYNLNIEIPHDTLTLGFLGITLTTAQFYTLLISLSIILSNFVYFAVEAINADNVCERPNKNLPKSKSTTKTSKYKKNKHVTTK